MLFGKINFRELNQWKYWFLDCTRDMSVKQLSFTIRFLDVEEFAIKEHFVKYKNVVECQGLYESVIDFLRAT